MLKTWDCRYDHRWTFPRSFHVSPFNSRDGYYTLSLVPPFSRHHPSSPSLCISLLLLTPSRTPKLFARLASPPAFSPLPLTARNVLSTILFRFPISLFLTTPRIMYHAFILHFRKGLGVYARPEPVGREKGEAWSEGEHQAWGRVDVRDAAEVGGIGWKAVGIAERRCREWTEDWIRKRMDGQYPPRTTTVRIVPSNPNVAISIISDPRRRDIETEQTTLTITPISSRTFTLFALSPTPHITLALSQAPANIFLVSSSALFVDLFSTATQTASQTIPRSTLLARTIRNRNPFTPSAPLEAPPHYLEPAPSGLASILAKFVMGEWLESAISAKLGVWFVDGGGGWKEAWRKYAMSIKKLE